MTEQQRLQERAAVWRLARDLGWTQMDIAQADTDPRGPLAAALEGALPMQALDVADLMTSLLQSEALGAWRDRFKGLVSAMCHLSLAHDAYQEADWLQATEYVSRARIRAIQAARPLGS